MADMENSENVAFAAIAKDPVAAAEALLDEFGGARKRLYNTLAKALAIAEVLEGDSQKWEMFQAHVRRKDLHVAQSPMRAVMCFLFTVKKTTGPAYDRACCYTRAIEQLRRDEKASAAELAKAIRARGGIESLYAEAKRARESKGNRHESKQLVTSGSGEKEDDEPLSKPDGKVGRDQPVKHRTVSASGGKRNSSKNCKSESLNEPRKYTKGWCEQRLILEIAPAKLQKILNMRNRKRGSIEFVFSGVDEDGFKIYNVESFNVE